MELESSSEELENEKKYIITKEGSYVDIKCNRIWRPAKIINNDSKSIAVSFIGIPNKSIINIPLQSPLIAPFRLYSTDYKGEDNSFYPDFHLDPNMLKMIKDKINVILDTIDMPDNECININKHSGTST